MQPIVKKKRRHDEDDMQKALFSWITLATPRIPQLALAFAVPNGGKRDAREAARLKGLGVRPGVPDVIIAHPQKSEMVYDTDGGYWKVVPLSCGLAIELKAGKNKPTPEQNEWHKRLRDAGWHVVTCYSFDEARQAIADYFGVKP